MFDVLTLSAPLFFELLGRTNEALGHQAVGLGDGLDGCVMVAELGADCAELEVVSDKFLFHFGFGGVVGVGIFGDGTSLGGGFAYEVFVVEDDAFEVVAAVAEFPKFLIDGGLVVEYGDDKFFGDVFA